MDILSDIKAFSERLVSATQQLADVEREIGRVAIDMQRSLTAFQERLPSPARPGSNNGGLYAAWTPRHLPGIFTHFRSGQRVILDPRDPYIAIHFLETGEWEEHLEPVWQEYLSEPGSVFVDVGANVGIHSIRATKYGAQIHAFEPDPHTYAILSLNLSLNGSRTVSVRNVAVSASTGKLEFAVSAVSAGLSGAAGIADHSSTSWLEKYSVDAVTLDSVVPPIAMRGLLKIDVEGHEASVLSGAERFVRESRDLGIVIEYQRQQSLIDYFKRNAWYMAIFTPSLYKWGGTPTSLEWERLDDWDSGDLVLRKRFDN
jgi:FkbM family methyltransferase